MHSVNVENPAEAAADNYCRILSGLQRVKVDELQEEEYSGDETRKYIVITGSAGVACPGMPKKVEREKGEKAPAGAICNCG